MGREMRGRVGALVKGVDNRGEKRGEEGKP